MKSSWRRPGTNRPFLSVTVAVTLTRSTPLRKRKSSCFCPDTLELPATITTAAAAVSPMEVRRMCFMMEPALPYHDQERSLHSVCQFCVVSAIDVWNEIRSGAEADAVTRDRSRSRNTHLDRRFFAGTERHVVQRNVLRRQERPVPIEQ